VSLNPVVEHLSIAVDGQLPFDPPLEPAALAGRSLAPLIPGAAVDGFTVTTVGPGGSAHLVYVHENLARLLGYEPSQLLGRCPSVLVHRQSPDPQLDAIAAIVDAGAQAVVPLHLSAADGRPVLLEGTFLRLPTLGGAPMYLSAYRDPGRARLDRLISEQDIALVRLARGGELSEVLAHLAGRVERLAGSGRAWCVLVDRSGDVQPVLCGDHDPDLVVATLAEVQRRGDRSGRAVEVVAVDDLPDELAGVLLERGVQRLWLVRVRCPEERTCGLLAVAHAEPIGPSDAEEQALHHLSQIASLAVERSQAKATLVHQALHDNLTGLPNRTLIMDRLEQAVARLGRDDATLAVLLVDLDRFRVVNELHGPLVGDRVLVEVSRRLRASVRLGDTVGRLGGDQFLAVCVAIDDGADVSTMAERIIDELAVPVDLDGRQVHVTASVGVATVTRPGRSAAALISSAETALHRAARDGRGRWALYEEGSRQRIVVRHEIEQALQLAITEAELLLHYQPVVDLRTGRMVGAEALIRWDRPGHGLLPPAGFIDIAEETGLIVPVGRWAIDETCRDLAEWPGDADGRRPLVSVNLSARQLADPTLVATVLAAVERNGLDPTTLGFEVTESVRVEDLDVASASLRRLAALGCTLSIDDFGVGYATLDHLRRFSMAHVLKIDRSFVSGLGTSREDTAIVSASIALAKSLGLLVIAEGVERPEQFDGLRAPGVELAQGFAISPPVPLDQARSLWEIGQLIDGRS
jgi:diguanylate cyclase (GGDEF)-like protein